MINESLKSARKKYRDVIDVDTFQIFIDNDKSKSFKYVEKMCELYYDNDLTVEYVVRLFNTYQKYEQFIHNTDLTKMTLKEIKDAIDDAIILKNTSNSALRKRAKSKMLIYDKDYIKIYQIDTFEDMELYGKGTDWCIALNKSQFNLYNREYNIFVIQNMNYDMDDKFRKVCYLYNDDNEMIVDKNNIHYFSDTKVYSKIKEEIIPNFLISQL